jgi:hypothetical protein
MPALILNVNIVGEGDVVVQLDCEVDDTIKDIAKGAVDYPSGLDHSAKLRMWAGMRSVSRWAMQPETQTLDKESAGDHP